MARPRAKITGKERERSRRSGLPYSKVADKERQIAVKMHMLDAGTIRMRKSIYLPADKSELFDVPVSCALVRHEKGNVLFDTGCHPSAAEDPEGRWGALAKMMTPVMPAGVNVLNSLKAIGLGPDDIDVV